MVEALQEEELHRTFCGWSAGSSITVYMEACGLRASDFSILAVTRRCLTLSIKKQTTAKLRELGIKSFVHINPFYVSDRTLTVDISLPCDVAASTDVQGQMLHGCFVCVLPKAL